MPNYTGSTNIYAAWLEEIGKAANLGNDIFKMLLTTSSYTPDAANHAILTDITNEVSGFGYARQTLGSVSYEQAGGSAKFDFADPTFSASGGPWTARYWVIYDDTVAIPAKPLVAYGLLNSAGGGTDVVVGDGNFITFQVNAAGLFTLS